MYMYSIGGTRPVKLSVGDTGVDYVTKLQEILFVNKILHCNGYIRQRAASLTQEILYSFEG